MAAIESNATMPAVSAPAMAQR